MKKFWSQLEWRIPLLYALIGALWIFLSDWLVAALVTDPHWQLHVQNYKGWFFVLISSLLIFFILRADLVKYRKAMQALQVSEQRFERMASNAQDIIYRYRLTPQPGFDYVSPAATSITGYTPEDHYANPNLGIEMVHPDDRARLEAVSRGASAYENPLVLRWVRKDGTVIWTEQRNVPIHDPKGQLIAIEGIARDITERKRAEEVLQQYNERLEQEVEAHTRELRDAQEALVRQEKLATLGQLAGGVGHELRNPLSAINNAVYYLKLIQPEADEKVLEYLAMIENEIKTGVEIINDLLEFSRLRTTLKETIPAAELVQSVLERFPPTEGVQVTRQIPAGLAPLAADRRQMEQVLGNLVVNAYQAMPEGGRLAISARQTGKMLVLTIKDNGMGISAENINKVFEPLFTTKPKGIGLGLAVSKKIVEANDGKIEVQSQPGKGCTFQVRMPIKPEEEK